MKSTLVTALLGLAIGAVLVLGALWAFDDDGGGDSPSGGDSATGPILSEDPPDDPTVQIESARAFLREWLSFRNGRFVVRSTFERTTDDGSVLDGETTLIQDPPNRIVTRLGGVTGVIDGRPVSCLTAPAEEQQCFLADTEPSDYDADVRSEIETMATYFGGPAPLYTIEMTSAHCYSVVLTRYVPAAPYGFSGELCFDSSTGALADTRFVHEGLVEHTVAVEISEDIPAGAFDLE